MGIVTLNIPVHTNTTMAVFSFLFNQHMLPKLRVSYLNYCKVSSRIAYANQSLDTEQEMSLWHLAYHLTAPAESVWDCIIDFNIFIEIFCDSSFFLISAIIGDHIDMKYTC